MALLLLSSLISIQPQTIYAQVAHWCREENCDGSTYDCLGDEVCHFICLDSCKNVAVTNAKELTISCSYGGNCDGSTFECDEECNLVCRDDGSCRDVTVTNARELTISCSRRGNCDGLNIVSFGIYSSLYCYGGSCRDVTINAPRIQFDCRGGICDGSTLHCDKECVIYCGYNGSCKNVKIITADFGNVKFECEGGACDQIQVNGCHDYGEIRMNITDDSEYCLTVGSLGTFEHSLVWLSSEENLVWQSVNDQDVYCPTFCYNKDDEQISLEYEETDYSLEWDYDLGGGNQIEDSQRNAKIDTGDGDEFIYHISVGSICATVDGVNCCLEADDDEDIGYERDNADTFKGYEAKFECNGDNTNAKSIYFHHESTASIEIL